MDFRRSGQLDERRRRVLMDEIASPAEPDSPEASAAGGSAKGPVRAYHAAVLSERQPKVTDLLPVRPVWVFVALVLSLAGVVAIEAIHIQTAALQVGEGASHLAALDATQRGSLAAWYSSVLLALAAALALVVFGIRAHRVDDYRGQYRVWLWTAAALVWLSVDAATGIHDALGLGLTFLAGQQVFTGSLAAGCTLTWIVVYGLVLGTLALRLAFEVRSSLWSAGSLLAAGALYSYAAILQLEVLATPVVLAPGVLSTSVVLLANLALLCTIGFFARHVYLDATGRLKVHIDPAARSKTKRAKLKLVKSEKASDASKAGQAAVPAKTTGKATEPARFGASPAAGAAKPGASISKGNLSSQADDEDDEDDDEYGSGLSKSERRRLKKLARREQRRAA
jgi:hypothetical protein